jgi:hypothetical protein
MPPAVGLCQQGHTRGTLSSLSCLVRTFLLALCENPEPCCPSQEVQPALRALSISGQVVSRESSVQCSHGCVVTVARAWPSLPSFLFHCSLCIFCGERNESFTEEGLDLHYWKHCLMLTRCDHCRQVRSWAWAMAAHKSGAKPRAQLAHQGLEKKTKSKVAQILEAPKEKSSEQRSLCCDSK